MSSNRVTKKKDSPKTEAWKKRVQTDAYAESKKFGGTREQYTTLAAYYLEDQWQDNPNNPSPMKGFKEKYGVFESTIAGETRQMQPKTTSSYTEAYQGGPKVSGESPKGVTLVSTDTVDSFSETRRFNEAIPIEIEIQVKAMELNGTFPDGSPLPPNFGWKDFKKKVSSGINDLKKIQKVLKSQGEKVDRGHWLPIGAPEYDNAARHRGDTPPSVGTSERIEDQTANRGGGARSHKDPKRSALAVMGVPRTWKEVLSNYAMPEGVPDQKSMFGNTRQLEAFAQWSRGKTDAEINNYVQRLPSSYETGLQRYDKVSGLPIGTGADPSTLPKAPDLPPSKFIKAQRIARNTMKAATLMRRMDKREAIFDAVDSLAQGDFIRAGASIARLTPIGATANVVGESVNALTQATTGQSIGERLTRSPGEIQAEHAIFKAKNERRNRKLKVNVSKAVQQRLGNASNMQKQSNTESNWGGSKALENVKQSIIDQFGEGAIYDPKAPKEQGPLEAPKPRKQLTPAQQRQLNIDAQYGGRANRLAGRGLGTYHDRRNIRPTRRL